MYDENDAHPEGGNADVFDKCRTGGGYFGLMRAQDDHYFTRPTLPPIPGRRMEFQGRETIMWSVNNYLGLADSEEIKAAALEAVQTYSVSAPMGSRMMTGNTPFHQSLEAELATFSQKEAAFLFNYGYLGVLGTIQSLITPADTIVMDKLAHACIVDGAFLSRGQLRVFKHNSAENLESVLKHVNRNRKGGVLILVEGVYGMTGDLAILPDIAMLAQKYEARIFVDDAHGWGVMGEHGRGTADYLGVQDKIDIYFGTFAKAFASIGGFAASTKEVIEWITYNARTQVFAKSLPMVFVQSLRKGLELVQAGDDRRERMWANSKALKSGLQDLGFYVGNGDSPICSVFIPVRDETVEVVGIRSVTYLRDRGVFVTAITYPVIPLGLCMYRMIPTAQHTQQDVEDTIAVFKNMRDELKLDLSITGDDLAKVNKVFGT
ncbi:MAG: aminotransferase class I/II-fold pyridoxal phosphate-dependent enzyme [Spirochaetales bacterium]|nr:MAG: aminotransferase class I/II-fold pyridoxal phosphate-dependent enzyme [Spirochaetales bacterium]